jgi:hypothetical protein
MGAETICPLAANQGLRLEVVKKMYFAAQNSPQALKRGELWRSWRHD